MSLKRKIQYVYTISSAVVAFALVLGILLSIKGMSMLTDTLDNNDKALKLYKAVTKERNALKLYFEDEQAELPEQIDEVRNNTKDILGQIPADYSYMNEEQYIIIQSIHNIYDSYDNIYNSQKKLFYIIPVICIIIAFVVIILSIWIRLFMNRSIVKPILKLSDEARRISVNDYSGDDIIIEGDDEISLLIKEFTQMKHSTKNYIVTLKEKHKVEQQLEHMRFEMLKNQINPHFLFNTLNLIAGTAEIEDAVTTEKMINTLSRLFRYNLKTQTSIMPLEQEVKIMDDYMYLQQMRFGQRIKYMCDVDNSSLDELVPAFVLQPLIENAIIHGLSSLSEGGLIYVRGFKKDDKMWLSIADTGVGIEKDKLDSIRKYLDNIFALPDTETAASSENDSNYADSEINRKTVGVGIGNIAYRVKGMYNNSGMKIYSRKNHGTVIQIYFGNNSK